MVFIAALLMGMLFGLGLIVADMINPAKVMNFLDLFGTWDPSLIFVMGGAIAVAMPSFYLLRTKVKQPLLASRFNFPTRNDIDKRLVIGTALFGIGWGLGGFCPGPALTSLPLFNSNGVIFVVAMITGMIGATFIVSR